MLKFRRTEVNYSLFFRVKQTKPYSIDLINRLVYQHSLIMYHEVCHFMGTLWGQTSGVKLLRGHKYNLKTPPLPSCFWLRNWLFAKELEKMCSEVFSWKHTSQLSDAKAVIAQFPVALNLRAETFSASIRNAKHYIWWSNYDVNWHQDNLYCKFGKEI